MREYPCKDCKDRYIGCHGQCEKYKSARKENEEEKKGTIRRRTEVAYTGADNAGHRKRMSGKYHGGVLKSPKR